MPKHSSTPSFAVRFHNPCKSRFNPRPKGPMNGLAIHLLRGAACNITERWVTTVCSHALTQNRSRRLQSAEPLWPTAPSTGASHRLHARTRVSSAVSKCQLQNMHSQRRKHPSEKGKPPLENSGKQVSSRLETSELQPGCRREPRNIPGPSTTAPVTEPAWEALHGLSPVIVKWPTPEPSWRLHHLECELAIGTITKCQGSGLILTTNIWCTSSFPETPRISLFFFDSLFLNNAEQFWLAQISVICFNYPRFYFTQTYHQQVGFSDR